MNVLNISHRFLTDLTLSEGKVFRATERCCEFTCSCPLHSTSGWDDLKQGAGHPNWGTFKSDGKCSWYPVFSDMHEPRPQRGNSGALEERKSTDTDKVFSRAHQALTSIQTTRVDTINNFTGAFAFCKALSQTLSLCSSQQLYKLAKYLLLQGRVLMPVFQRRKLREMSVTKEGGTVKCHS